MRLEIRGAPQGALTYGPAIRLLEKDERKTSHLLSHWLSHPLPIDQDRVLKGDILDCRRWFTTSLNNSAIG